MDQPRNIQYEIKRPAKTPGKGRRASFQLQKTTFDAEGRRTTETIKDPRIDAVNQQYTTEIVTRDQANVLMEEIRKSYREKRQQPPVKVIHNPENYKLLDKYWEAEYEERDLQAPDGMRSELVNAIDAIGTLSLASATTKELREAVASKGFKVNKQRRYIERLNMLLKYLGRPKLKKPKAVAEPIKYLSEDEWTRVRKHVKSDIVRLAADVSFFASPRLGEVFDLERQQWQDHQLWIKGSLTRKRQAKGTKTDKPRLAYVTNQGKQALAEWFAIPKDRRLAKRNEAFAEIVREACQKVFPDDPMKWLTLRDFRHCYAIHLVSKGVSISLVAQSMGNSVTTCQEHYAGFSLVPESIANIARTLNE